MAQFLFRDVIHNPINFFPVYEPSAERVKAVEEALSEANNPLASHYDSTKENRAKGAGFFQFSTDEEKRKQQLEELRSARTETEKTRQEVGAVDLKPGEVEGLREDSATAGPSRSRAVEKRKREIEERRKLVDAKRRKVKQEETSASRTSESNTAEAVTFKVQESEAPDPFAKLERHTTVASDQSKAKGKQKGNNDRRPNTEADAFLAQLEQEILRGQ
jgi:hypothetical protein